MSMHRNFLNKELSAKSQIFDVLADKNRLKILALLLCEQSCVNGVCKFLNIRQNLVSHHLKVMKEAGIVKSQRSGREIYYSINPNKLFHLKQILDKIFQSPKN